MFSGGIERDRGMKLVNQKIVYPNLGVNVSSLSWRIAKLSLLNMWPMQHQYDINILHDIIILVT